jgi:hypothetical protein
MSYLAKLLAVYRERERTEAAEGYVLPDTYLRVRECAAMLIGAGVRRSEGAW